MPLPPPLPVGRHVKVVRDPEGGFQVVTTYLGFIVGPRLDRNRGEMPTCGARRLTFTQACAAFEGWETFCEAQTDKKKKR